MACESWLQVLQSRIRAFPLQAEENSQRKSPFRFRQIALTPRRPPLRHTVGKLPELKSAVGGENAETEKRHGQIGRELFAIGSAWRFVFGGEEYCVTDFMRERGDEFHRPFDACGVVSDAQPLFRAVLKRAGGRRRGVLHDRKVTKLRIDRCILRDKIELTGIDGHVPGDVFKQDLRAIMPLALRRREERAGGQDHRRVFESFQSAKIGQKPAPAFELPLKVVIIEWGAAFPEHYPVPVNWRAHLGLQTSNNLI
ncbi:hypothetical protein K1W69_01010 [Hoeflea sp. WL0058]|uniref:Uncharacterized protein n=1 Tax=Flavimaribacter sediminis TaxID=2865987 RepID=A0AAE2ZFT2_9HYPH|nr:hypothetical protein [Flavimaribacter sediminis]MBW8635749.1 hypothetical protein [Flavimaribacter sediminis]